MRFSILAAATALLGAVMAGDFAYITSPVAATTWTAPSSVTIKWTNTTSSQTVDLFTGDPTHQTLVQSLGTFPAGALSLKATLPSLPSNWYSIRVGDSWSHYFLIKGTGAVPTGGPPTAAATTAAVAPATSNSLPTSTGSPSSATTAASTPLPTKSAANGAGILSAAPAAMAVVVAAAAALAF